MKHILLFTVKYAKVNKQTKNKACIERTFISYKHLGLHINYKINEIGKLVFERIFFSTLDVTLSMFVIGLRGGRSGPEGIMLWTQRGYTRPTGIPSLHRKNPIVL